MKYARPEMEQRGSGLGAVKRYSTSCLIIANEWTAMSPVLITGSSDGLGLATAFALIAVGHDVVLHARTKERASLLADIPPRPRGVDIGDLRSADQTRRQSKSMRLQMDTKMYNAGINLEHVLPDGQHNLALNVTLFGACVGIRSSHQRVRAIDDDLDRTIVEQRCDFRELLPTRSDLRG